MRPLESQAMYADEFVRQKLAHLESLRSYSTVSAEIDLDFPGIKDLKDRYDNSQRRSGPVSPWDKPQPLSRRASKLISASTTNGPNSLFQSNYTVGTKPWSRLYILDPTGARVDPLTGVELALKEAGEKEDEMRSYKADAQSKLREMCQEIADLEDSKNRIRNELETQTAKVSHCSHTIFDDDLKSGNRETDVLIAQKHARSPRVRRSRLQYPNALVTFYDDEPYHRQCLRLGIPKRCRTNHCDDLLGVES